MVLAGGGTIRPVSLMSVVSRFGHWKAQVREQQCVLCCAVIGRSTLPCNYNSKKAFTGDVNTASWL